MKMSFISSGAFWGTLLILAGIAIILKIVFGIHFPFFKILLGILFIYIGVRIIAGVSGKTERANSQMFGMNKMKFDENNPEQSLLFSKGIIDYSNVHIKSTGDSSKINVLFSEGIMLISEDTPLKIRVSSAFSGSSFPDGTNISFGDYTYTTKSFSDSLPYLSVKVDVAFSSFRVKDKSIFNK